MALSHHVPGAHQPEAWLFLTIATGRAIRPAQASMKERGAPQADWSCFLPRNYQ